MITTRQSVLAACLVALGLQAQAQVTSHYPAGIEGIRAASLPPQGLYFRDYNYFYTSDNFRGGGPPNFDVTAYVQAPRLIWMTDWKPLGFNYGMDIIVPFAYTSIRPGSFNPGAGTFGPRSSQFGLADIAIEPLLLSRTFGSFDVSAGYALWAPTGSFDPLRFDSPGKGFWGHMITLGGTYFFDKNKTVALSLLDRYEINQEQDKTHITPGQQNTLEAGLSLAVTKTIDVGLIGYYVQQTTDESGVGSSNLRDRVVAAGPEVNIVWPSVGLITSLRYAYEIDAQNRSQGHTACLTLTYRF